MSELRLTKLSWSFKLTLNSSLDIVGARFINWHKKLNLCHINWLKDQSQMLGHPGRKGLMYLDNFISPETWKCKAQMCVCSLNVDISLSRLGRETVIAQCCVNSLPGDGPVMLCWWSSDGDECRHRTMENTLGYGPSPQHPRGCPPQT